MEMYGNEMCCLDATYKTSRYALPLFFVVVPTNSSYQVVATFLVASDKSDAIQEAVGIVKGWNPSWNPGSWMTDCCSAEIRALEELFPAKIIIGSYRYVADKDYHNKVSNFMPLQCRDPRIGRVIPS